MNTQFALWLASWLGLHGGGDALPALHVPREFPAEARDKVPVPRESGSSPVPVPSVVPVTPSEWVGTKYAWFDSHDERSFFGFGAHLYEVEAKFRRDDVISAITSFGIPADGFTSQDVEQGRFVISNGLLRPDWVRLAREARPALRPLLRDVLQVAHDDGVSDAREVVGVISGLVQDGLAYKLPDEVRTGGPDGPLNTGGVLVPLETLTVQPSESRAGWGWGDCDTKSVLFVALVTQLSDLEVVLLFGRQHMFAGVSLPPEAGEDAIRFRGKPYVLIELTAPGWTLGHLPADSRDHIRQFSVLHVPNVSEEGGEVTN